MTFDYTEFQSLALELLTEYGRDVTRKSYTTGTYDVSTGAVSTTTANTTRKGALFDFANGQTLIRGSLIQVNDKRLLVDASAAINQQDHFIVGSDEYVIVSIGEINPAGTSVLYDLHVRMG